MTGTKNERASDDGTAPLNAQALEAALRARGKASTIEQATYYVDAADSLITRLLAENALLREFVETVRDYAREANDDGMYAAADALLEGRSHD